MMTTEVKERPILFSGEMVRAILEGRKTQTRRPVTHPAVKNHDWPFCMELYPGEWLWLSHNEPIRGLREVYEPGEGISCPYGEVGERLWVRETWGYEYGGGYLYKASHEHMKDVGGLSDHKWRPSIHMPREASRILLEITHVWAERLQDISEKDAIAEGVERDGFGWKHYVDPDDLMFATARQSFFSLITSIYGPEFLGKNPWMWAVKFKIVEP